MTPGSAWKNTLVGLVFLGSLAILGATTLLLSTVPILGGIEKIEVRFDDIDSLQEGDDVLLHGFRVGQVDDISYEPAGAPLTPIRVRCTVPADIAARLGQRASFSVRGAGPLGGRYVEISLPAESEESPAPEATERPAGEEQGRRPAYVGTAAGDVFTRLGKLMERNEENITKTIDAIRSIAQDIDAARGVVGQLIQDPVIAADVASAISNIREIFEGINEGRGTIGAIVRDEDLRGKVSQGINDLAEVIAGLRKDESTIGFLLNNRKARDDIDTMVSDARTVVTNIKDGDGLVSRLINDEELATDVRGAVHEIREIAYKANSGEGTLAQLINNPRAWEELMRILILARETIEDLREQAPISTFVNALFATF